MTTFLRPSDGAVRQGTHIDLNHRGYKAGERVLFEPEFGKPCVDTIDAMDGNWAAIDGARILVTNIKGRIRPGTTEEQERALVAALEAAFAASPVEYHQSARRRVMREHRVR